MTALRTFIAIELTDEARQVITVLQNRLKANAPPHTVRWTAAQNIHLTLHFLGNVEADDIAKVNTALHSTVGGYPPVTLSLGQLGCFPNLRRPRIIWVGVWGNIKPLVELHGQLGQALKEAIGFTPETRPYAPHLTIGRVNQEAPLQRLRQFSQIMEREQAVAQLVDLPVTEISLIKSELYPAGPVYTVLSSERLGGRP